MTAELFWLTLTAMMTSMFWLPYMIDRVNVRGVMGAFGNPGPDAPLMVINANGKQLRLLDDTTGTCHMNF